MKCRLKSYFLPFVIIIVGIITIIPTIAFAETTTSEEPKFNYGSQEK